MKINYRSNSQYIFYETEIKKALDWLYKIRDDEKHGWAWVQFILPNEQNTAEVIYTFTENEEWINQNPDSVRKLVESINSWLLDTKHARISIDYCWVLRALQKVRKCKILMENLNQEKLEKAICECIEWLSNHYKEITKDEIGWIANDDENPNVIRTALAVMGFNEEIKYYKEDESKKDIIDVYSKIVKRAYKWLLSIQNQDGGWGNLSKTDITQEYQRNHDFSYKDLTYQCESNAASTGYTLLALISDSNEKYESEIKKAVDYLKASQMENGGWSIFTEIGVRDGEKYTFRHFSTAWALQGIIQSELGDYRDECVIHGFEYLSNLQDSNYGGWRSSPDADNYTWATCNALTTINMLKNDLAEVHAKHFLNVVWDWWTMKKKDANYNFKIGNVYFAFNGAMALSFCITFSIMITLILALTFNVAGTGMNNLPEAVRKLIYSIITVLAALVLGLPWIVYVKNRFKQEVSGWIDSIGWVYGIITGFVLVLYQFIL